jgi:hypothetical protein
LGGGEGAGLLVDDAAGFEDHEVRNALDAKARGEIRVAIGVDFEHDRFAGEVGGDAPDFRSDAAARATPRSPEVDQYRHTGITLDVFEGGCVDIEGFGQRRQGCLAGSAAAGIGQVLRGHAVFGSAPAFSRHVPNKLGVRPAKSRWPMSGAS